MREKILLGIGLLLLLLVLLFLFFRPEDTDAPTDPGAMLVIEVMEREA